MITSAVSLPAKNFLSLLESEQKALEQIARGMPLVEVLERVLIAIEDQSIVKMHASILFLDKDGKHLVHGIAPSLPKDYNRAVDGLETGPAQGSCGAAVFLGEAVCVADIAKDPLWKNFRDPALSHGLRACWSTPIHGTGGELLGSFSEYYLEPRSPTPQDIEAIGIVAKIIAVIMERNFSAQNLIGAESRYRQIFNSATDFGIISADLRGVLTSWNEGARRIFGWSEQEMLGHPVHRFFTPEDVADGRPETEMACALRDGYATDERWHVRKSGQRFWASGALTPLKTDAGEAIGFVKILRDRTEQKRTEQDLQFLAQASAELGSLVDQQSTLDRLANLAVQSFADWCVVDLLQEDGTLKRLAAAHKDSGKRQLAQDLMSRFPVDPNAPHGAWNVLRTGQAELISEITDQLLEETTRNPEYLAALRELGLKSYIGAPLAAHGKTMGVVSFVGAESGRIYGPADLALAEDLARRAAVAIENANLYRALQRSDSGKDIFLATLAHELRNPLAAITNGLSIMKLASGDKNRTEQAARIIERQVGQLTRLVDDLMDVSRIATGKIELRKEYTNLASILNTAIETSRPHMEQGNHKLSVSLPGGPTDLFADPVRLAQVFANLLHNAAKYTNHGGQIDVVLECMPEEFVVRIKDNGVGISPEMLTVIFSIFAQISHPLEHSQGGLGIGLSLVEGLVRMHGGRVEAFSAGPDQGSEFVVHLPRTLEESAQPDVAESDASLGTEAMPKSRRILVVDDNTDAAATVAEILDMLGNDVAVVHDGLAAVAAAADMQPDVVLLDIGLPGIDGYEAARRIRAQDSARHVTLIAITGWGQEKDKRRASEAGFDDHWVKPVSLDQLRKISS
ncbi:MAG: hypothetical protein A3I66_23825 [Burkholderiales bacterium RIFCSPLOWO2_02_FULL_57_36]|nr:MAG: hypothetical protein A3I66_23825 [Burkholderiales bacterium RIFCSPLOWO2_02_FULL_57_36]